MNEIVNKPLYFFDDDQINISNSIHPDDLGFFEEYYSEYYSEIVYYEYDRPVCPKCGSSMNSNGSRQAKPNKWEGIECWRKLFNFEHFSFSPFYFSYIKLMI